MKQSITCSLIDATCCKFLSHAFAADFVQLVQRDERSFVLFQRDTRDRKYSR